MTTQIKELQSPPQFQLITDQAALYVACQQLRQHKVVAIDTEFTRRVTFHAKLGLVQLYAGDLAYLVDPLEINDLSPLVELLADKSVLKVLHACSEDIEVLYHHCQQKPEPIMDTQVMARFLGFPGFTGFATLIQHYFQLTIEKETSRTNWLARPLSDKQLVYAAADVWYLLPLYQQMMQDLAQTEWQSAAQSECELLRRKPHLQECDPELAYLGIYNAQKLNRLGLMRLKLLAKWRLEKAISRDLPINFVVRTEHLLKIAKNNPKQTADMLKLGLPIQKVRTQGKAMLKLLQQVKYIAPEDFPPLIARATATPYYRLILSALQKKLEEMVPHFMLDVVANRKYLDSLIKWYWLGGEEPEMLQGWRKPFGEQLIKVINDVKEDKAKSAAENH